MTEVQEVDDAQADSYEQRLAAAVSAAMAEQATDASLPDVEKAVAGAIAGIVKSYALASAVAFVAATGRRGADGATEASSVASDAARVETARVARRAAEGRTEALVEYARDVSSPARTDGHIVPARLDFREHMRKQAESYARSSATGLREGVRHDLAVAFGGTNKTWRTKRDARVRLEHGGLEGDTVPIHEPFRTLDGRTIRYPGDPEADIDLTAGCRCRLTWSLPA